MNYRDYLKSELSFRYENIILLAETGINFSGLSIKNPNLKELMPTDLLYRLKSKKNTLVIDLSQEGEIDFIQQIYESLVSYFKIPASQIVFVCSSPDYKNIVAKYSNTINLEWFMFFALHQQESFIRDFGEQYEPVNPLIENKFQRCYLNLNRRWKSHRQALISMLYDRNLLDKGFNSFSGKDFKIKYNDIISSEKDFKSLFIDFTSRELHEIFRRSKGVYDLFPLRLDTDSFSSSLAHTTQKPLSKYFRSSYFSVVTETLYDYPIRFITEKIFRPISFKHPFIIMCAPNSLEILHRLGYKTFHPYINESYNKETDPNKRLIMIVDEIERLSNLNQNELDDYRTNLIPIVEHNYKQLMSKQQIYRKLL